MSASTEGIGPLSVRYAVQIRELLYTQAVQRAAAEQEAARDAESAKKAEAAKTDQAPQANPFKFDPPPSEGGPQQQSADARQPPTPQAPAQKIDLKA